MMNTFEDQGFILLLDGQPFNTSGNRIVDKLIAKHNGDLLSVCLEIGSNIQRFGDDAYGEALDVAENLIGRITIQAKP